MPSSPTLVGLLRLYISSPLVPVPCDVPFFAFVYLLDRLRRSVVWFAIAVIFKSCIGILTINAETFCRPLNRRARTSSADPLYPFLVLFCRPTACCRSAPWAIFSLRVAGHTCVTVTVCTRAVVLGSKQGGSLGKEAVWTQTVDMAQGTLVMSLPPTVQKNVPG